MICLADNDIIKKLAICDLLDEFLAVLDCVHADIFVFIDAGEVILFSATAAFSDFVLATGDKRSLKALAGMAGGEGITARLSGRV